MSERLFIIGALTLALALAGCQKGRNYWPKDLESQNVEIVRFDKALLNVDEGIGVGIGIRVLYDEYPVFMPLWVENILGIPASDTAYLEQQLPAFLNDTLYGFKQTNAREQEEAERADGARQADRDAPDPQETHRSIPAQPGAAHP